MTYLGIIGTVFFLKTAHVLKAAHSGEGIEKNRPWAVFRKNTVYAL
jgi:hypothetical protein